MKKILFVALVLAFVSTARAGTEIKDVVHLTFWDESNTAAVVTADPAAKAKGIRPGDVLTNACYPVENRVMEEEVMAEAKKQNAEVTYLFERAGKAYKVKTKVRPDMALVDTWLTSGDARGKNARPILGAKRDVAVTKVTESATKLGIKQGDILRSVCAPVASIRQYLTLSENFSFPYGNDTAYLQPFAHTFKRGGKSYTVKVSLIPPEMQALLR